MILIRNKIFWTLVLLAAGCLIYLNFFSIRMKDAALINNLGERIPIAIPYLKDMPVTEYTIYGKIYFNSLLSVSKVHIMMDDVLLNIRINQQEINFAGEGEFGAFSGFNLNMAKYLVDGLNYFECRIYNRGGLSGLTIENSPFDIKVLLAGCLLIMAIIGILYFILTCFKLSKGIMLILLGSLLLRLLYFMITPYDTRSHDVDGHISYINFVLAHWAAPDYYSGLQAHQPPLYYFTTALIYKAGELLGIASYNFLYRLVQFFSVLLSMGFLCFAFAIFEQLFSKLTVFQRAADHLVTPTDKPKQNWFLLAICGLIAFWPSSIIHSARIGNDALLYFFYAGGLFFLIRWYFDNQAGYMYLGFIFATLSLVAKANGIILIALFGIIYLWKLFRDHERRLKKYLIRTSLLLLIFCAGAVITFGTATIQKIKGSQNNFLVPNPPRGGDLGVGNELKNYVWFDLPDFVTIPYANPIGDAGGRQYFWNYLFKTSLIGEFHYDHPLHRILALLLSYEFLGLLLFTICGLVFIFHREWRKHLVLALNLVLLLLAALLFRVSIPAACSNDFRYVLPLLISFCFFFGYSIFTFHQRGWKVLVLIGWILTILFITTSSLFLIGLLF